MIKVNKKIFLMVISLLLLVVTSFAIANPYQTRKDVYASLNPNSLISKQSTLVNNVILFTFSDHANKVINGTSFTPATNSFVNTFNDKANNDNDSLQKYYYAMSDGNFTIQSNLVMDTNNSANDTSDDKPFVVVLDNPLSYYTTAHESEINDAIFSKLNTTNTTVKLDSSCDSNNDGYVDIFTFIFLDFDAKNTINNANTENEALQTFNNRYTAINSETHSIENLASWPHRQPSIQNSFSHKGNTYNYNQCVLFSSAIFDADTNFKNLNLYFKSTYFHEMGHVLGLPDCYLTDFTPTPQNPNSPNYVGEWDLMGSNYMQSINAYFKNKLGWTDGNSFAELTTAGTYTLKPSNTNELKTIFGEPIDLSSPMAYYITDPAYPNQKIVLEYRHLGSTRSFDYNLNGMVSSLNEDVLTSGLTIYRINENNNSMNHLVIDSNSTSKASIFYFRTSTSLYETSTISMQPETKFGKNELTPSRQTDINTPYISFQTTFGSYENSNLVIEVKSIDTDGCTFTISGGNLEKTSGGIIEGSDYLYNRIADDNLLIAIGEILNSSNPYELTYDDLIEFETLRTLDLSNKNITDLSGIASISMPSLTTLILNGNKIVNGLDEIGVFTSITNLQMFDCGLTDINFTYGLSNLNYVNFACNQISYFGNLNPSSKPQLIFANIVLNNLNVDAGENEYLFAGVYDDIFAVGIQCFPSNDYAIGVQDIYFYPNGVPNSITLDLKNNSITKILESGLNQLGNGKYNITYRFKDDSIAKETNKTLSCEIIVVTLKKPIVEIMVGDNYEPDSYLSFNDWKSTYQFTSDIVYQENNTVSIVDTTREGKYTITFTIYITPEVYFNLVKIVYVYKDDIITNDELGIPDRVLYEKLLNLVDKGPIISGNEYLVGTQISNTLYAQDLYFFDILEKGEPITELNFANSGISSLQGISLLNLTKITSINLNLNNIPDISPLFEKSNSAMPNLESLHLANMGLDILPGNIGYMYSLKYIDLSFNNLQRVDALKPLIDPVQLMHAGQRQKLELVNLNMNDISFDETPTIDYNAYNGFIRSTVEVAGFKPASQVFIILVQGLQNYESYINEVKFGYYPSEANTYIRNGRTEYRFVVSLNGVNKMDEWNTKTLKESITLPRMYTVSFRASNTPFELTLNSRYNKVFYLSTASVKSLKDINNTDYTLEDLWKDNSYYILSTERIENPNIDDINFGNATNDVNLSFAYAVSVKRDLVTAPNPDFTKERYYTMGTGFDYTYIITYVLRATGTINGNALISSEEKLTYELTIKRNSIVTIHDENLAEKLSTILKKPHTTNVFYSYDTYKLTKLDLSNSNIESLVSVGELKDFRNFEFDNLTYLNLSKNNLETLDLTTAEFPKLRYLDVSYNRLTNSIELKSVSSSTETLYVLAFMNYYVLGDDEDEDGINNNWLVTGRNNPSNLIVFAGIQGINSTDVHFITYEEIVDSAARSTAGFFFIERNLDLIAQKSDKSNVIKGTTKGNIEELPNHYHNFYYYYTEAGTYPVVYNLSFGEFNFRYQGTIVNSKAYASKDKEYIVDFDKNNTIKTIEDTLNFDYMIYENCSSDDFIAVYELRDLETDEIVDNIALDELRTYTQQYTLTHIYSNLSYRYKKTIIVKDREAPTISMREGYEIIQTIINTGYNFYNRGYIDRDIEATDNYDTVKHNTIQIIAQVKNSKDEILNQVYVPINTPDTYTITYYAVDSSGNESERIVRKVKVEYNAYETVKITKPAALVYVNSATFQITVYRNDDTRDLNPTFNWYIDGVFVKQTVKDANLPNPNIIIKSTTELEFTKAGKHKIEVRVNENSDPDFENFNSVGTIDINNGPANSAENDLIEENARKNSSEVEFFILLDKEVVSITGIVVGVIILLIIIVLLIIKHNKKRRTKLYNKYEYNIVSKQ